MLSHCTDKKEEKATNTKMLRVMVTSHTKPQSLETGKGNSRETRCFQHLNLGLLASTTVREQISVVLQRKFEVLVHRQRKQI
jgi:hypothetical protein